MSRACSAGTPATPIPISSGSARHRVAEAPRGHRNDFAEDIREVALINEPHGAGNLANTQLRLNQQPLRPFDARPHDVVARRHPQSLPELSMEVEPTDAGDPRQIIQTDRLADLRPNKNTHPPQLVARQATLARGRGLDRAREFHHRADALPADDDCFKPLLAQPEWQLRR